MHVAVGAKRCDPEASPFTLRGVGGRYWYTQTRGLTHFENHIVGFPAAPQPVEWKTQSYGVFVQGSIKLGPYALIGSN